MWFINTILGHLIMQIIDILRRKRSSNASPSSFSFRFFFKDTWLKILLSFILSVSLSLAIHLNWENSIALFGTDADINELIYLAVGAIPETILAYLKRKIGFLQVSSKVDNYNRKAS